MATPTTAKRYEKMTTAQLAAATKHLDTGVPLEKQKPMSARNRAVWESISRGPGRPAIGAGCKDVLISMEVGLLRELDARAKAAGVPRSQLIAQAVRTMLNPIRTVSSGIKALGPRARINEHSHKRLRSGTMYRESRESFTSRSNDDVHRSVTGKRAGATTTKKRA
jgi:hypothetical protein